MSHLHSLFIAICMAAVIFIVGCSQRPTSDIATPKEPRPQIQSQIVKAPSYTNVQQLPGDEYKANEGTQLRSKQEAEIGKSKADSRTRLSEEAIAVKRMAVQSNVPAAATLEAIRLPSEALDRENYVHFEDNAINVVTENPVSTFSIDVDTGSYANVRRILASGQLPRQDAVRVEELINYFDYQYDTPTDASTPFAIHTELAPTPWNPNTVLLQIGIKGYEVKRERIPVSNLVFLIDVSGSMQAANKLELLKNAMKLLTRQLRTEDRVSIVVYAGASGVVLEPVGGDQTARIHHAIDRLSAGGSTNGGAGIRLAYSLARQHFVENGINRVILATDGDFNVGTVDFEALKNLIERERETGVTLTTLGFGAGNYNDHLMEQLADVGNGNYAYIDTLNEAQKVLVEEMSSTLHTIAKDVKIQIEFNPSAVTEYRLIGYENRVLNREDFNNDKVDAGDVGAGHTITALYELSLVESPHRWVEPLRYGENQNTSLLKPDELAFLKLRYKHPTESTSNLITREIYSNDLKREYGRASDNYRFAAAVAAFGQILRGGTYVGNFDYSDVVQLARSARGEDKYGYRNEFVRIVGLAQNLQPQGSGTGGRKS